MYSYVHMRHCVEPFVCSPHYCTQNTSTRNDAITYWATGKHSGSDGGHGRGVHPLLTSLLVCHCGGTVCASLSNLSYQTWSYCQLPFHCSYFHCMNNACTSTRLIGNVTLYYASGEWATAALCNSRNWSVCFSCHDDSREGRLWLAVLVVLHSSAERRHNWWDRRQDCQCRWHTIIEIVLASYWPNCPTSWCCHDHYLLALVDLALQFPV